MKTYINLFGLVCFGIAVVFLTGMDGCSTEDPVAFIEASPEDGSRIQKYKTITVTFDGEPIDLNVPGADFSVVGSTVTIAGPFAPGEWAYVLTWTGGSTVLTYTVETPEAADPPVVEDPPVVHEMNLIVPGRSAGGIKIGVPLEKVRQLYGEPDWVYDDVKSPGNSVEGRNIYYSNVGLEIWSPNKENVVGIRITSPSRAKTAGGVGIGSTRQQIENEFGKPDDEIFPPGWKYPGIAFYFEDDDKVGDIFIGKPPGARR